MSDFKSIDSCVTMESFRSARSYNDIVVVLSTIRGNTESILNRLHKKSADVKATLQDIQYLEEFSYSIQFSKTLNVIGAENKMAKYKTLCSSIENLVNTTISQAYYVINQIGEASEPELLKDLATSAKTFFSKFVRKYTSIVIPNTSSNYTHYFILSNISNSSGYMISEFIVALNYDITDNVEVTSISFPSKMFFEADKSAVSKRTLVSLIESCLGADVLAINKLSLDQKQAINTIDNVSSTYIEDNHLCIELIPGISPTGINITLTKLLPVVYIALGITDPRKDIIHRIAVAENGNKVIRIALMNRNFYEGSAIRALKRRLNLNTATYNTLLQIAGL